VSLISETLPTPLDPAALIDPFRVNPLFATPEEEEEEEDEDEESEEDDEEEDDGDEDEDEEEE
jgi:hypothetical protein